MGDNCAKKKRKKNTGKAFSNYGMGTGEAEVKKQGLTAS